MATVKEVGEPRRVRKTTNGYEKTREYLVEGIEIDSPEAAVNCTDGPDYLPQIGDDYPGYNVKCQDLEATQKDGDPTRWVVRVTYRPQSRQDSENSSAATSPASFQFGVSASSKKMMQALSKTPTNKSFGASGLTIPPSEGMIGFDGTKIQGADIPTGIFKFSISTRYAQGEIDASYIVDLSRKLESPKWNDAAWSLWERGELLLEAVSGRYQRGGYPVVEGDDVGQLGKVDKITGVGSTNSLNGQLFVSIEKYTGIGNYKVYFYKDPAMTKLVAQNELAALGENTITAMGGSGIGGSFTIYKYVYDTTNIVITFPLPWEVKYDFSVSPNVDSQTVGDVTVTNKLGWEYMDVRYGNKDVTVDGKKVTTQSAKFVYLHTVLESMDFDDLRIDPDDVIPE